MNQEITNISNNSEKTIQPEKFDQVVEAILAGKYSWACVLILRFSGYNPLHYIPYRTYNRLLKENAQVRRGNQKSTEGIRISKQSSENIIGSKTNQGCLNQIKDLAYLEVVGKKQKTEIRGGNIHQWLDIQMRDYQVMEPELRQKSHEHLPLLCCDLN
jgi:hypothetical protein